MIDVHCHISTASKDDILAINNSKTECIFICSTSERDWNKIAYISGINDRITPFFGLHPWYIEEASDNWQINLEEYIIKNSKAGIGEIGLDKLKAYPQQRETFIFQLELAIKYNRLVNVHCVKDFDNLLSIFGRYKSKTPPIILHSFSGHRGIIGKLCDYNCFFSFSPHVLRKNPDKVKELLSYIPLDRLLLESDAEDIKESLIKFPSFALKLGDFIGMDYEELVSRTSTNAERLISNV